MPPNQPPRACSSRLPSQALEAALSARAGKTEVEFYTTVVHAMRDPATVRCYDAVYAPATGQSHVLLEDVSDTHFQPEWPLPPTQQHCEAVMECLATLHAFWWEHPRLGKDIGQLPTEEARKEGMADTIAECATLSTSWEIGFRLTGVTYTTKSSVTAEPLEPLSMDASQREKSVYPRSRRRPCVEFSLST